jgi:DNA-binding transcriptional ArsR family regulator
MDSVAQALADPIRREILRLLRARSATAGWLAEQFDVSRPAVSRHLRVLREAQLVKDEQQGREREYRLELSALSELEAFLRELRGPDRWQQRFDALETEVARVRKRRNKQATQPTHKRSKTA